MRSRSRSRSRSGPFSPLEDLERRLTEISLLLFSNYPQNTDLVRPLPSMARNFLQPRRHAGGSQPPNTQGEDTDHARGLTRWPVRRPQLSTTRAATQISRPVRVSSRVPTLPELPRFPSLPDFEGGNSKKVRSSTVPNLRGNLNKNKPLPPIPESPPTQPPQRPRPKQVPSSPPYSRTAVICQSENCPIKDPHLEGLYLHNDQPSKWRHPYWGVSNPPPYMWRAWDRRTDKVATSEEVRDIFGFIECHAYGKRGKAKERATSRDYEAARLELEGTQIGIAF